MKKSLGHFGSRTDYQELGFCWVVFLFDGENNRVSPRDLVYIQTFIFPENMQVQAWARCLHVTAKNPSWDHKSSRKPAMTSLPPAHPLVTVSLLQGYLCIYILHRLWTQAPKMEVTSAPPAHSIVHTLLSCFDSLPPNPLNDGHRCWEFCNTSRLFLVWGSEAGNALTQGLQLMVAQPGVETFQVCISDPVLQSVASEVGQVLYIGRHCHFIHSIWFV